MKRWVLVILFVLLPTTAFAESWVGQTCTAASATVAEVQACINGVTSAMSGAVTINVPAGTQTWASGITLSLADVSDPAPNFSNVTSVTLAGAGASSTVITDNTTATLMSITGLDGKKWIVTGFGFTNTSNYIIGIYGTTGLTSPATQGFRVYGNSFTATVGHEPILIIGNTYGLIDSNTFSPKGRVLVECERSWATMDSKFTEDQALGSAKFVFMEDNTGLSVDSNAAGRLVYRFNAVTDDYMETHSGCPNGFRGVRALEYYKNEMTGETDGIGSTYRVGLIRSGTGVIWGNTAYGAVWNVTHFEVDNEASCTSRGCGGTPRSVSNNTYFTSPVTIPSCQDGNGNATFPCQDQVGRGKDSGWTTAQAIEPLYAWNNVFGATEMTIRASTAACAYTSTVLAANRDYYNADTTNCAAAGTSCTAGVGVKTKAQLNATTTCTVGVAVWVTDEGYWNSKNDTASTRVADGVLYKCTATNTWTPFYTPYPYPHPLRSGLSAPTGVTAE